MERRTKKMLPEKYIYLQIYFSSPGELKLVSSLSCINNIPTYKASPSFAFVNISVFYYTFISGL